VSIGSFILITAVTGKKQSEISGKRLKKQAKTLDRMLIMIYLLILHGYWHVEPAKARGYLFSSNIFSLNTHFPP
jgi:hypothetical protein